MKKKKGLDRFYIPQQYRPYVHNKYTLTFIAFLVWLTFFDKHDFILQHSYRKKLDVLKKEREYYISQIEKNKQEMKELFTNQKNLEKFAREKYYMKRDNEDVFVFADESKKPIAEK